MCLPVDDELGPFITILKEVMYELHVLRSLVLTSHISTEPEACSLAAQLSPQVEEIWSPF